MHKPACYYEKMIKLTSHYLLLFVLMSAFLTMPWTTSHIHLATQHHHNDSHHKHAVSTHAHNISFALISPHPSSQHADAIDFSDQASHNFSLQIHQTNTVDLNTDDSLVKKGKQNPTFDALTAFYHTLPSSLLRINNLPSTSVLAKLNYLDHSTVNPRAPPQISYFL